MSVIATPRNVQRVVGVGPDRFEAVRTRVEGLARLHVPSLLVPTRVSMVRADDVLVDEPVGESETLVQILDSRGRLSAGECVWLGEAVASALASMHREGLVHGALDAEAVVIAESCVALTHLVDAEDGAVPSDDIAALGSLLALSVSDADASRIRAWTDPMTHPDPQGRPSAAMVARALASCAPPEAIVARPVGVAAALRRAARESDQLGRASVVRLDDSLLWRARHAMVRWFRRPAVPLLAAVAVAGIVMAAVWVLPGGKDAEGTEGPDGAVVYDAVDSPADAARRLTLARFDALSAQDGEAVVALTREGSPARAEALSTAEALRSGSLVVQGLVGTVEAAEPAVGGVAESADPGSEGSTVVRVRYRLGPHVLVSDGVTTEFDGYAQTVDLLLEWVEGEGWLVSDAVPVDGSDDVAITGPNEPATGDIAGTTSD